MKKSFILNNKYLFFNISFFVNALNSAENFNHTPTMSVGLKIG